MSVDGLQGDNKPASNSEWNIAEVVVELRALRERSLMLRQRLGHHQKLPSRKHLESIVERLTTALFPRRLGSRDFRHGNADYFVGHLLDMALSDLAHEVEQELRFFSDPGDNQEDPETRAREIVYEFARQLPGIRSLLESDIQAAFEGDPAARSADEVLVCYPGVTAIVHHRLAHVLYLMGAPLVARMIAEIAHSLTGIDIHPGAQIAGSFFIDHGTGVVIGETAIIGSHVRLYQAVTLGAKRFPVDEHGVVLKGDARHPIVEDEVVIYAGATILGRVTIGKGAVIGGNVWLTSSVAPGTVVSQAKLRQEVFDGGSGI